MKYWFLLFFFIQLTFISAQSNQQMIAFDDIDAVEALDIVEYKYHVHFSYLTNLFKDKKVSLTNESRMLEAVLEALANQLEVSFTKINTGYYYIKKKGVFQIDEVILINYLTKGFTKNLDGSFGVDSQKASLLPGLTEPDILEQLQQLPSVLSLDDKASEFSVRGGVSDENRLIWNDINIYQSGHLFGMISALNPNIASDINFYYKGTPSRFGERISSVTDIHSKSLKQDNTKAEIGINAINIDALLQAPLLKDKLQVQVAIRRSYADLFKTFTYQKLEEKVFQNTSIQSADFHFLDASFIADYQLNKNNTFNFSAIHIDNALKDNTISINQYHTDTISTNNDGFSLSWDKKWPKKNHSKTTLSYSHYQLDYVSSVATDTALLSNYTKTNQLKDLTFSTIFSRTLSERSNLDIGFQSTAKEVHFSYDRNTLFRDYNTSKLYTYAGLSQYNYKNNKGFGLQAGLRVNYYTLLNAIRIEPRLVLNKKLNNYLNYQFTGEIKNQVLSQLDETVYTDLSLDTKLWHLNNGTKHPLLQAKQLTSGLSYHKQNWTADIDFYWKKTTGLSALALGYLNPNDPNIHLGDKKTAGASLYIKKSTKAFDYWLTYAYLSSQTKFEGLNNEQYFDSNDEVKHSFNTAISYKYKAFNVILGWKFASGRPISSYVLDNTGNISFNGINTDRLPNFHRLDLAMDYAFMLLPKSKTKAKMGVSIRNVYNNKSRIGLIFTGNNSIREPVKVIDKYAIGFMPNFLFRVYF